MKKLATVSLIIFGVIVTAILIAGLVFYQNKKDSQIVNIPTNTSTRTNPKTNVQTSTKPPTGNSTTPPAKTITLNMTEIAKHNKPTNCWMLISGKVYNITSYFGSHPGGTSTMTPSCGTDATYAYMTKDPYATTAGSRSAHSYSAQNLLTDYYIGDFNQTI